MPTNQELEVQARQQAKEVLTKQPNFSQLDRDQQFEQYKSLVSTIYNQLLEQERAKEIQRLDGQLAAQQSFSGAMVASDLISDKRHKNENIGDSGKIAGSVLKEVDFPKFVKDLLKSVFDANLQVTQDQMSSYAELVERITKPATQLINTIDDQAAKMFLAEKYSDKYKLNLDDDDDDDFGVSDYSSGKQNSNSMKLTTPNGSEVDEVELKGAIMQAKLELVRQQQRLLEEMLLMGVTRMVVENGKIKASVEFNITAKETINKRDQAREKNTDSKKRTNSLGGGVSALYWVGLNISAGTKTSDTHTNIAISTASTNSKSTTTTTTKVYGEVEINFKSDYFKLDNFKDILMQSSGQQSKDKKLPEASNADPKTTASPGA